MRVASPVASLPTSEAENGNGVTKVQFANRKDGYVSSENGDTLYWTGDGGHAWRLAEPGGKAAWQEPLVEGGPLASPIITTHGRAYILVYEGCLEVHCASIDLATSMVTSDTWTDTRLALPTANSVVSIAAFGQKVWLIVTSGGGSLTRVLVSHNGGHSFAVQSSTGLLGLTCGAAATSSMTLWGFCTTGTQGYAVRSTDGGRTFATLSVPRGFISNSDGILPVSDDVAVYHTYTPNGTWPLMVTRDGGRQFGNLLRFQSPQDPFDVAFASTTTWLALDGSQTGANSKLWRTTDAGRSWQRINPPGL